MKKIIFLFTVVSFTVSNHLGFAQNIKFGVKGGLNLATAKIEGAKGGITVKLNTELRPSFYLGGLAEFGFRNSEKLKIQTELLYTGNGTSVKVDDDSEKYTINQLTLPVLAKYYVIKNLALCAGGYIGYVLDFSVIDTGGNKTKVKSDNYNKIDGGLAIGAEYSITGGLFVDIRYNYGFADLIKFVNEGVETDMYNRFLQIGLGYKF